MSDDASIDDLYELVEGMQVDLEPLSPEDALSRYLDSNPRENTEQTLTSHRSRLKPFIRWCEDHDIENLNNLTGRQVEAYASQLRGSDLAETTVRSRIRTLSVLLQYARDIEGVKPSLLEKIDIPTLSEGAGARDTMVSADEMETILSYLDKYEYASTAHTAIALMGKCGLRLSTLRALDCEDVHLDGDNPHLRLSNRPETGTRLKNKNGSERWISISHDTASLLQDYLTEQRPDVTDESGREPLIATKYGRISSSTLRKYVYMWTRPCVTSGDCPHGRNVSECAARQTDSEAYDCPSSSQYRMSSVYHVCTCLTREATVDPQHPVISFSYA